MDDVGSALPRTRSLPNTSLDRHVSPPNPPPFQESTCVTAHEAAKPERWDGQRFACKPSRKIFCQHCKEYKVTKGGMLGDFCSGDNQFQCLY